MFDVQKPPIFLLDSTNILAKEMTWLVPYVISPFKPILINLHDLDTCVTSHKEKETKNNKRMILIVECSAISQEKLPLRLKDLGSFIIPYTIGPLTFGKQLRG